MSHLSRLANLAGYAVYGGAAYGRTNGIYFNVIPNPDGHDVTVRAYIRPIETLTFRDTGRGRGIDLMRINSYLSVRRRDYDNSDAQADERSLWLTLEGEPSADKLSEFLYEFSRFLSDSGYVSSCTMCPQTRNLSYKVDKGQVLEVCASCAELHSETLQNTVQQRNIKESNIRGAAGAAMGGIAGIVPWVLLNFVGYIAPLGGLIMAYFAYKGYRLMHGKRSRYMFTIIFAVLAVFTYIAVMACEGINIYRARLDAGYATGLFKEIGGVMTGVLHSDIYDTELLWMRLGIGLLFSGLGAFALVLRSRRETAAGSKSPPKPIGRTLKH